MNRTCQWPSGCDEPKNSGRGGRYCAGHREEARRRRSPGTMVRKPLVCIIEGCGGAANRPGTARGFCNRHYSRWQRTGDPLVSLTDLNPPASPICSVDGCEKAKWAQGLCPMHRYRLRRRGEVGSATPELGPVSGPCRIHDCNRPARNGQYQLCQPHYLRLLRHGDPLGGRAFVGIHPHCTVGDCRAEHYARGLCQRHWSKLTGPLKKRQRKSAPGAATPEQVLARMAYFGFQCWLCGGPFEDVDHVKPIAKGGSNWPANLRPSCHSCNSRKRSRWFGVHRLDELVAS